MKATATGIRIAAGESQMLALRFNSTMPQAACRRHR
jgi:hypothetical protein